MNTTTLLTLTPEKVDAVYTRYVAFDFETTGFSCLTSRPPASPAAPTGSSRSGRCISITGSRPKPSPPWSTPG